MSRSRPAGEGVSALALEWPPCPLCGADERDRLYGGLVDILHGGPGRFGVVRCSRCRLVYLHPRPAPADLPSFYPDDYGPWTADRQPVERVSRSFALLDRLARALYRARYGDPKLTLLPFGGRRLLDVGCGDGNYLRLMQRLGWDVHGVEVGAGGVRAARRRAGAGRVTHGTLADLPPRAECFDLIVLSHVLEHVADPRGLLLAVRLLLADEGRVRVIVPDVSGFEARLFGRAWLGLDVPRHLVDFSRATLLRLLRQTGFAVESCRPQYLPDLPYLSARHVVDATLGHGRARVRRVLLKLTLALALFSYPLGNRGAIDVLAHLAGARDCPRRIAS